MNAILFLLWGMLLFLYMESQLKQLTSFQKKVIQRTLYICQNLEQQGFTET